MNFLFIHCTYIRALSGFRLVSNGSISLSAIKLTCIFRGIFVQVFFCEPITEIILKILGKRTEEIENYEQFTIRKMHCNTKRELNSERIFKIIISRKLRSAYFGKFIKGLFLIFESVEKYG